MKRTCKPLKRKINVQFGREPLRTRQAQTSRGAFFSFSPALRSSPKRWAGSRSNSVGCYLPSWSRLGVAISMRRARRNSDHLSMRRNCCTSTGCPQFWGVWRREGGSARQSEDGENYSRGGRAGGRKRAAQLGRQATSHPCARIDLHGVCFLFLCCLGHEFHNWWLGQGRNPCLLRRAGTT